MLTLKQACSWDLDEIIAAIIFSAAMAALALSFQQPRSTYQPRSYCYIKQQTDARTFDFCTNVFGERDV